MDNPLLVARNVRHYEDLKTFVKDRPGHDHRYAIDPRKIRRELGWRPRHDFGAGIRQTVRWYLEHQGWCNTVQAGGYGRDRLELAVAPIEGCR